jgi:hypothetical protein
MPRLALVSLGTAWFIVTAPCPETACDFAACAGTAWGSDSSGCLAPSALPHRPVPQTLPLGSALLILSALTPSQLWPKTQPGTIRARFPVEGDLSDDCEYAR